jgi:hypothetical protein
VARAKRTDRAEARRRYRASIVEPNDIDDLDDEVVPAAPVAAKPSTNAAQGAARPSMGAAFRSAFRPLDLRGDLRALPMLLRHKSFLLPVILSGLSVAIVPLLGANSLTSAFFVYFAAGPPLGAVLLAGFLSPRASWLVGLLVCLVALAFQAVAFSLPAFYVYLDGVIDSTTNAPLGRDVARNALLGQALIGIPYGAVFAAMAAWYRRFLTRASPGRQRPAQTGARRPDGKRPKRNEPRPILARRR